MTNHLMGCVLVPQFLAVSMRRACGAAGPLAVASSTSDRATILDVSPAFVDVHMRMPVLEARRRHPELAIVACDLEAIATATAEVEHVLGIHTNMVQRVEPGCWTIQMDALGSHFRRAEPEAERLRHDLMRAGFPCVAGLGAWTDVARIAAEVARRTGHGCTIVRPGTEQTFLAPLPMDVLPLGERARAALDRLGITTVGQLARVPPAALAAICGPRSRVLTAISRGSIFQEVSTTPDTITCTWHARDELCADEQRLQAQLHVLVEEIGRMLRGRGTAAGAIAVQVNWIDGVSRRRTQRLPARCDLDDELTKASRALLAELLRERRLAVLRLSAEADDLGPRQSDLFAINDGRRRRLQQALDLVKQRYGPGAIQIASLFGLATYGSSV